MKKHSIQTIAKRFFLGNLLAAGMFLSAHAATVEASRASTDKAEVKYIGVDRENQLSFNVKYSNPSGGSFNLTVLDENGEAIYKGVFGDKQFDKTFKLPKLDFTRYTFVIEDGKQAIKQKFDVSVKTQVIEDVVVSKS